MGPLTPRNPRLRTKYPYNDMVWKKLDPDTKGFIGDQAGHKICGRRRDVLPGVSR